MNIPLAMISKSIISVVGHEISDQLNVRGIQFCMRNGTLQYETQVASYPARVLIGKVPM